MKLGIIGDTHFTNRTPERRKDNYFEAAKKKLTQAMDFFRLENVAQIFQVGDFFDTPTVANRVKSELMDLLLPYNKPIMCVYGQHDISGHSAATYPNSPIAELKSARVIKLLGQDLTGVGEYKFADKSRVYAYGASFGQDIPKVEFPEAMNILVIHEMIGNRPLWPGQELINPRNFLRSHPQFRLVLAGDYHYAFQDRLKDQLILNPGCLMRKSLTDVKLGHQPSVCVVDIDTLEVTTKVLDVEDAEIVFDLSKPEVKRDSQALNNLLEKLKNTSNNQQKKLSWDSILNRVIREKGVSKQAQKIIDCITEELSNV